LDNIDAPAHPPPVYRQQTGSDDYQENGQHDE
jgi:hypothetical protein